MGNYFQTLSIDPVIEELKDIKKKLKTLQEMIYSRYEHLNEQNRTIYQTLENLEERIQKNEIITDIYNMKTNHDPILRNMTKKQLQNIYNSECKKL